MLKEFEKYLKAETPHHSYYLVGNIDPDRLFDLLKKYFHEIIVSPEEELGIDFVRQIIDRSLLRSSSENRRVFVMNAEMFTRVARSALLKTIEEPPPYTYFILYSRRADAVDRTVRSRTIEIHVADIRSLKNEGSADIERFMKSGLEIRHQILADLETLDEIRGFVDELEKQAIFPENNLEPRSLKIERFSRMRRLMAYPTLPVGMAKDYLIFLTPPGV